MRATTVRVFPVPGPATMSSGPSWCATARRCSALSSAPRVGASGAEAPRGGGPNPDTLLGIEIGAGGGGVGRRKRLLLEHRRSEGQGERLWIARPRCFEIDGKAALGGEPAPLVVVERPHDAVLAVVARLQVDLAAANAAHGFGEQRRSLARDVLERSVRQDVQLRAHAGE